jgi:hypothetical protein
MKIDRLNGKLSSLESFSEQNMFLATQTETIVQALEASLKIETEKLVAINSTVPIIPSDDDIWKFIRSARRYGYLKEIDRGVLEELIDKIYVSANDYSYCFQGQRITIKFKNVGVINAKPLINKSIQY